MQKKGFLGGVGSVEIQQIAIVSGNTTAAVTFNSTHGTDAVVVAVGNLAAIGAVWVSGLTGNGCTLNFSNPSANGIIYVLIVG